MNSKQIVCVSGGFDPYHVGHARMLQGAAYFGRLVVILNSDKWIIRKHGYILVPWTERKEMLMAVKGVDEVVRVIDEDDTVCEALKRIRPDVFANGGLRTIGNTPERAMCEKLGIKMVWGIGGGGRDNYSLAIHQKILNISGNSKP